MTIDTHERWYEKRWHDGGSSDQQCMLCRFYVSLRGPLGYSWGVCANATSPHDGTLVFEHAGCKQFKPESWRGPHRA